MSKTWVSRVVAGACVALGLSACGGGGGGSNVKPNPPPGGGAVPVEPSTVTTANLIVKSGESVTKPVVLTGAATTPRVDNAGFIGGSVDVAISGQSYYSTAQIVNHDGGIIDGRQYAIKLGGLRLDNSGPGSEVRSAGTAVRAENGGGFITNTGGASIIGGTTAISLENGGIVRNFAGSTIATTGSVSGDCGAGGSCAIYASPNAAPGETQQLRLENAGTIMGNVQLASVMFNSVVLTAGGTIQGNLDMGTNPVTDLTLDVGAGRRRAVQRVRG